MTNYSFFLGRPIVPRGLEEVEPKYQVSQRTSEAAKWAGELTGFSPLKIDNLYQSWTGGLGRIASEAVTAGVRAGRRLAGEGVPPEPTPTAADIPGLRGFVARTPGASSESIERFYDALADAREARSTLRFLAESRQPDEARRVAEQRQDEFARLPQLEAAARTLSELRAQLDMIRRAPNMTPEDKRDRIDQLGREMTRIAAAAIRRRLPAAAEYAGR
ncbi:MAG: LPD38 domain-containing protein [Longimicrobiales bacterium]